MPKDPPQRDGLVVRLTGLMLAYILQLQSATSASKRISRRQVATSGEQASTGRAAP